MLPPRIPLGQISGNRRVNTELTPAVRNRIIGAHLAGASNINIIRVLKLQNVDPSTISKTITNAPTRSVNQLSQKRSGRPSILSQRALRSLQRSIKIPFQHI